MQLFQMKNETPRCLAVSYEAIISFEDNNTAGSIAKVNASSGIATVNCTCRSAQQLPIIIDLQIVSSPLAAPTIRGEL